MNKAFTRSTPTDRLKQMSSGSPTLDDFTHQLDDDTHRQYLRDQTITCAEKALEDYNNKGLCYTLDKALNSNGRHRMGHDVVHVNFTAKKDGSGTSEHFFAEITYNQVFQSWFVRDCVTFNPDAKTNVADGCTMCLGNFRTPILHPAGHYLLGQYAEYMYACVECHPEMSSDDDC